MLSSFDIRCACTCSGVRRRGFLAGSVVPSWVIERMLAGRAAYCACAFRRSAVSQNPAPRFVPAAPHRNDEPDDDTRHYGEDGEEEELKVDHRGQ